MPVMLKGGLFMCPKGTLVPPARMISMPEISRPC
jgi:hypothetical protein